MTDLPVLTCEPGSVFIAATYSCMSQSDVLDPEFGEALLQSKSCSGGLFTTSESLQQLRMCNEVQGPLILENISDDIDTTVFWDIHTIAGRGASHDCWRVDAELTFTAGGFAMRNCSSIVSIDGFKLLGHVGSLPDEYVQQVLGASITAQYSVLITGMRAPVV
jgi:hypothetical protein